MTTDDRSDEERPRRSVVDQVLAVAASVFRVPRSAVTPQSTPDDLESWDSIRHLTLMLALEQHFAITIAPEDTDDMGTLDRVARVVERELVSRHTPAPHHR